MSEASPPPPSRPTLTIPFVRNWNVLTPAVVRYMDRQYVDEFFDSGSIRLSSFAEFSRHEDELRLDAGEGMNILVGQAADQTIFAVTLHGRKSYILSTSMIESQELKSAFDSTGCLRIVNTTAFGLAVARRLSGFRDGLEGPCLYQDGQVIRRRMESLDLEALKSDPDSLSTLARHVFRVGGADVFFVKLRRYASQAEYRLVWNVMDEVAGPLIVECPEAREYCEPVE